MGQWRVELLGRLRARRDGETVQHFRTHKTGALLAYLSFYRDRPHPRELLIEMLWPGASPDAGRNNLSRELSALRGQLERRDAGEVIIADRHSVRVNPTAVLTDVADFEAAVGAAPNRADAAGRAALLTAATDAYGGELLPGYYQDWITVEREWLAERHLAVLLDLARLARDTGDHDRAVAFARRAIGADPLRELSYRELMALYIAAGEPWAAWSVYRELEQELARELAVSPSPETQQIAETIRSRVGDATSSAAGAPAADASLVTAVGSTTIPAPSGTVTFLAVGLGEALIVEPVPMDGAADGATAAVVGGSAGAVAAEAHLASVRALVEAAVAPNSGYRVSGRVSGRVLDWVTAGASDRGAPRVYAFGRAGDALLAAVDAQQAVATHAWPAHSSRARLNQAIHSGDLGSSDGGQAADFDGPVLGQTLQMLAAAQPGQILCSTATASLVRHDLEPDWQLVDLGRYRLRDGVDPVRLFQVDTPRSPTREFGSLRAERCDLGKLPLPLTRFFGRERELARLTEMVRGGEARLITLTGPPGSGKTRLALEVASALSLPLQGAAWFVPLAGVRDAGLLIEAVLEAMQRQRVAGRSPIAEVAEALGGRPGLLVLDDFEHLVDRGVLLIRALLQQADSLVCLVTSRRRLDLPGELEYPVPPLPPPPRRASPAVLRDAACVQMFVDRAQAAQPHFHLTDANTAAVAELCQRLEGIPLAIELAAARSQVLTPAQMLDRLGQRFDLLAGPRRSPAHRHHTLRAAIEWSYDLLAPDLRRFLVRLSVFRDGWTLEAAEAVAGETGTATDDPLIMDALAQLVDCSLIDTADDSADAIRFRMLETLREYMAERLNPDERAILAQRHAGYYLDLAERAAPELKSTGQARWLAWLDADYGNLRAVLAWSTAAGGDIATGLRLGAALRRFWELRGSLGEGRLWLDALLAHPGVEDLAPWRARVLDGAGALALQQGDHATARRHFDESVAIKQALGDDRETAETLRGMGNLADEQGLYAEARSRYAEALALYRAIADHWGMAATLNGLGLVCQNEGDLSAARQWLEEGLAAFRTVGETWAIGVALFNLGGLAYDLQDYPSARAYYDESLAIAREIGDRLGVGGTLTGLANVAAREGDREAAAQLYAEGLVELREVGDRKDIAEWLEAVAALAQDAGDAARAARLFASADALREELGAPLAPKEETDHGARLAALRAVLGEAAFAAAWAEGRGMGWERVVT